MSLKTHNCLILRQKHDMTEKAITQHSFMHTRNHFYTRDVGLLHPWTLISENSAVLVFSRRPCEKLGFPGPTVLNLFCAPTICKISKRGIHRHPQQGPASEAKVNTSPSLLKTGVAKIHFTINLA